MAAAATFGAGQSDRAALRLRDRLLAALLHCSENPSHFVSRLFWRYKLVGRRGASTRPPGQGRMNMRRPGAWVCVAAATAAAAICGFAPWPVSPARVAASVDAALGDSSHLRWLPPQAAALTVLPWPRLNMTDARVDDAFGVNILSAQRARLDLSARALLRGRFAPVRVELLNPIMTLDLDRPPFADALQGLTSVTATARGLEPSVSLSLSNGVVRLVSVRRGLDTVIEGLQARLDGVTIDDALRFDATAVWRDEPITISGELDASQTAASGAPRPFRLSLVSPAANFTVDGALARGDAPSAEGDVAASLPSLDALTHLFGGARPAFLFADDIAFAGRAKATPKGLMFESASVTSANQSLEGALELTYGGGRLGISGTLAADRLALAPILGSPASLLDRSQGWSRKPFALAALRDFDLDLRLSAVQLDLYGGLLANAAASLILKDGVLSANLIEAAAYQGRLQGVARAAADGETVELRASAEIADADLGRAFADFGWPVPSGRGGARFAVETSGGSPADAVAGLNGSASIELSDGSIAGVNLEEALRRSRRRPLDLSRDMRRGETAFDRLALELDLERGVASVVRGDMTSPGVKAELAGGVDIVARTWDLSVQARQTGSSGHSSPDEVQLTFAIQGPWRSPSIRTIGENEEPRQEADPPPL